MSHCFFFFFFFNDTATTEIYTLSLHDALPISFWKRYTASSYNRLQQWRNLPKTSSPLSDRKFPLRSSNRTDRKSTRLNSSHSQISYAVFCLKKKKKNKKN